MQGPCDYPRVDSNIGVCGGWGWGAAYKQQYVVHVHTYKHTLPDESDAVIARFQSRHLSVVFLLSSESLWPPGLLVLRLTTCPW